MDHEQKRHEKHEEERKQKQIEERQSDGPATFRFGAETYRAQVASRED